MRLPDNGTKKLLLASVLCGLAMALSVIDFTVSAALPFLPGIKLGLANIVTLFALYALSLPYVLMICAVRSAATALLSGYVSMLFFSLSGGLASILVMYLLMRKLRLVKVSVAGAVTHNIMQVVVAGVITSAPGLAYYAPVLVIMGCASGFLTGAVCSATLEKLSIHLR